MAVKRKPEAASEALIYVGPSLERGRLAKYTIFRNGIPGHLKDLLEQYPQASNLIVPVSGLSAIQTKVNKQGTAEYQAYTSLLGKGNHHVL